MKSHPFRQTLPVVRGGPVIAAGSAFNLIELLVVMSIISILAALTLPALGRATAKSRQIHCLNQLRQIGIASIAFGQDHNDRLPVQLWTNGCPASNHVHETIATGALVRSYCAFLAMSNELANPRILTCRSDKRTSASDFPSLRDENVSYAVGLQASLNRPESILAMDANVVQRGKTVKLDLTQGGTYDLAWTKRIHNFKGNLLFADAHVELRKHIPWTVPAVVPPEPETSVSPQGTSLSMNPSISNKDNSAAAPKDWEKFTNGLHELFPSIAFQPQTLAVSESHAVPAARKHRTETSVEKQSSNTNAASVDKTALVSSTNDGSSGEEEPEAHPLFFAISEIILLLLLLWLLSLAVTYGFKYWRARRI